PNGARMCACGFTYWKEIVWAKTTLDGSKIRGGTGYHYRAASERILFFEKGKRALDDLGVTDVLMAPRSGVPGPAVKPGAVVRPPTIWTRRAPAAGSTTTGRPGRSSRCSRCGRKSVKRRCGGRCGRKRRGRASRIGCGHGAHGR